MAENTKLVSVIIPAYNAGKTIEETLASVFAQDYPSIEIIVINDGSTDNTSEILKSFQDKIRFTSTTNKGVSSARQLGFEQANGQYIQYLDADDLLMTNKIKLQINALIESEADIAYGDWEKFIEKDNQFFIVENVARQIKGDVEIALFTDFWCPPAAILYARKVCEKLKWSKTLPVIQDARYFLDAAMGNFKFSYTPGIMAQYRSDQSNSLSQKSNLNFVKDLYTNTKEIYQIWLSDFEKKPEKREVIIKSLRHCINRLSVLDKPLAKKSIDLLLKIDSNYIPPESGFLRTVSKIIGYKNAEQLAGFKRSFKK